MLSLLKNRKTINWAVSDKDCNAC